MTESRRARYPSTGMNSRQRYVCTDPAHREHWQVIHRRCNYSAFNGYRYTPSAYSHVWCPDCGLHWRTKAAYVDDLPDAPADWYAWKPPDAGKVEPPGGGALDLGIVRDDPPDKFNNFEAFEAAWLDSLPDAGKIDTPGGEVWYADLTSFRGVSLGAIHWYLRVTRGHGRRLRVERVLTAAEAEAETANDDRFRWKEGQWKEGWTSVETAEAAAVAVFRHLAADPDRDVLLLGSLYSVPDKVLSAPPDVAAEIAAVDRDDYRGMDRLLSSRRLTVRPGPGRYGPNEPPEDPDLPEAIAVGPNGVETEERDLYGDVTTLMPPGRTSIGGQATCRLCGRTIHEDETDWYHESPVTYDQPGFTLTFMDRVVFCDRSTIEDGPHLPQQDPAG